MQYKGTGEYFLIFNELVTAARYRGTVTYQELAHSIGLPITGDYMANELGQCLGEISEDQVQNNRPMLSAVAVKVSGLPGEGFFTLAKKLDRFYGADEQRRSFWEAEVQRVYVHWTRKF
jgi:hypothetical protein